MPTEEQLHSAVAAAIGFFADSREPEALLWLDVMHRRFDIAEFAAALQRFDRALAEQPTSVGAASAGAASVGASAGAASAGAASAAISKQVRLLRVFRRMADRDNAIEIEDLESVSHPSDRIVVSALYCDRLGLPPSFPDVLAKAVKAGGYYLPHVLLAWVWIRENGGELPLPDGLVEEIYRANAAIVNDDPAVVSDLRLEAAAFLHLAGEGARVADAFVASVIATQNADGGWGTSRARQGGSDWHATILGLLLLLHLERPVASADGRPGRTAAARER